MSGKMLTRALLFLAAVSCRGDQPVAPRWMPSFSVGTCNTPTTSLNSFAAVYHTCGQSIKVYAPTGGTGQLTSTELSTALAVWNNGVLMPPGTSYNLPHFASWPNNGTQDVTVSYSGSGAYWCGSTPSTDPTTVAIVEYASVSAAQAAGCTNSSADHGHLVGHELGHALGWDGQHLNKQITNPPGGVTTCVDWLPSTGGVNTSVCEWERQTIFAAYGVRGDASVALSKEFAYALDPLPGGDTLLLAARVIMSAQPYLNDDVSGLTGDQPPQSGEVFTWSFTSGGSLFTQSVGSNGWTDTLATADTGNALLQTSSSTEPIYNVVWPFPTTGHTDVATLRVVFPAPSAVSASNVTSSGATVSWTAGDTLTPTTVQYRLTGSPTWTSWSATSVAAGVRSVVLSPGHCGGWDLNLYHTYNTKTSPAALDTAAFVMPAAAGACAPPDFYVLNCHVDTISNVLYEVFRVNWLRGEYSTRSSYEIEWSLSNNSSNGTVIRSGASSITTDTLGPYLKSSTSPLYFWIRTKLSGGTGASAWVVLDDNPLVPHIGC
jgi:hypothetical protein